MKVYTVHERGAPAADRAERAENLAFVSDGFHWLAAIFAPFTLVACNLWAGLAIYAAAVVAMIALMWAFGASAGWIVLALVALHLVVGFEFNELRRSTLDAQGWSNLGTVTGRTRDECERRFFENWLPGQPLLSGLRSPNDAPPLGGDLPAVASPVSKQRFNLPWSRQ